MLEKYDETVSEFATIVSKENDKGDVVVLVDTDDIKKRNYSICKLRRWEIIYWCSGRWNGYRTG